MSEQKVFMRKLKWFINEADIDNFRFGIVFDFINSLRQNVSYAILCPNRGYISVGKLSIGSFNRLFTLIWNVKNILLKYQLLRNQVGNSFRGNHFKFKDDYI